jgi:hypothetical protein
VVESNLRILADNLVRDRASGVNKEMQQRYLLVEKLDFVAKLRTRHDDVPRIGLRSTCINLKDSVPR